MKTGKSLVELAQEIERQAQSKRDYVTPTTALEMTDQDQLNLDIDDRTETFDITPHTHRQIAERISIPAKYYQRMQAEAPTLLADNVNHWFAANPEKRMVRTLDGKARAFLSDRYRILDNYHLLDVVMNTIFDLGLSDGIASADITESKLYLKVINKRLELEVQQGDVVQAGFCISNSEIGLGAVKVEPLIYRLACTNGMISQDYGQKRYHVGRAASEAESYELFADDTLKADDEAFFLKVRDTVRAAVDIAKFSLIVERMREATQQKLEGNPVKAVEVTAKAFNLNQGESSSILTHLIQGGDLTAYGLLNAVTRTSQDVENYDRATELEAMGSQVLSLPQSTWKEIALAR